jgi:hypothetical protein
VEAKKLFSLEPKDYLVMVPLFGSAIAVCYDVGFFWGIDISYFSVFSLSEQLCR